MRTIAWQAKKERWRSTKMINAIKQFFGDRKLFKQAAKDLKNKDLQAKAKYAYEHRGDNLLTIIDYLAILCAVLIAMAIVWCWM